MVTPHAPDPGDADLVCVAHNTHTPSCGLPPRVRTAANPRLYHGYFENRYSEQFVFTFDRATGSGTVAGGDLSWDQPRSFTLESIGLALRATQALAAQIEASGGTDTPALPVIDAALALGRLTGLTGKDEVIWLRACLAACTPIAGPIGNPQGG